MAKNKPEIDEIEMDEDDFDLDEMMEFADDGAMMNNALELLVQANRDQMHIALELTKLIIGTNGASEEKVLSTFTQANKTVAESSMMKEMMNQLV